MYTSLTWTMKNIKKKIFRRHLTYQCDTTLFTTQRTIENNIYLISKLSHKFTLTE